MSAEIEKPPTAVADQSETSIQARQRQMQLSLRDAGPHGGREWHNFLGNPRSVWRLKALAQSQADKAGDIAGEIVPIKYWYLQEVQVFDPATNEYTSAVRTVLMRPNLTCVAFVSTGIVKAIQSMVDAIGVGPYDPAIEVRIESVDTRMGRRVYTIIPAE